MQSEDTSADDRRTTRREEFAMDYCSQAVRAKKYCILIVLTILVLAASLANLSVTSHNLNNAGNVTEKDNFQEGAVKLFGKLAKAVMRHKLGDDQDLNQLMNATLSAFLP